RRSISASPSCWRSPCRHLFLTVRPIRWIPGRHAELRMHDSFPDDGSTPTTYNLLFVCTGNTCRSPLAEAVARREIARRGWHNVAVRSAGVAAEPGSPATEEAVIAAAELGLDLSQHRSR